MQNQLKLGVAADEAGEASSGRRVEAALLQYGADMEREDRIIEALDLLRFQRLQFEAPFHQFSCRFSNDHATRRCHTLEPRCEVRRFAHYRPFRRRSLSDDVTDHHQAGGYTDARLQAQIRLGVEHGYRGGDIEPRPHGAFGVVLVGPGIAEVGENAIAHVAGHETVETIDCRLTGILVSQIHLPQILRVQTPGEFGRADQIAEHHRKLAPFCISLLWTRRCRGGINKRRRVIAKRGDRLEKFLAWSKGNGELFQILFGQLGKNLEVDLLFGEQLRVLAETEPVQPLRHIVHLGWGHAGSIRAGGPKGQATDAPWR